MDINIKLLDDGKIPVYKTDGSVGADCFSRIDAVVMANETKIIPLGFAVEIPKGYEMQIRPRSGLATQGRATIFGTIDSDYRGEVCAIMHNDSKEMFVIEKGDRICQLVISEVITANFNPVLLLNDTDRNTGGFGSTGKKD